MPITAINKHTAITQSTCVVVFVFYRGFPYNRYENKALSFSHSRPKFFLDGINRTENRGLPHPIGYLIENDNFVASLYISATFLSYFYCLIIPYRIYLYYTKILTQKQIFTQYKNLKGKIFLCYTPLQARYQHNTKSKVNAGVPIKILIGGLHRAYNRASASALYFWLTATGTGKRKSHLEITTPTYNRFSRFKKFFSRNIAPLYRGFSASIYGLLFYWFLLEKIAERNKINIWLRSCLCITAPILPFSIKKLGKLPILAVNPNTYFFLLILSAYYAHKTAFCPPTKYGKNQTLPINFYQFYAHFTAYLTNCGNGLILSSSNKPKGMIINGKELF